MAISMLKIRRPLRRLIFNMGIAIPGKTVFLIETAPWFRRISDNGLGWIVFIQYIILALEHITDIFVLAVSRLLVFEPSWAWPEILRTLNMWRISVWIRIIYWKIPCCIKTTFSAACFYLTALYKTSSPIYVLCIFRKSNTGSTYHHEYCL